MWENVHTTGMRVKARTGFEPVLRADDDDPSFRSQTGAASFGAPADLQRIVERLTQRRGARESLGLNRRLSSAYSRSTGLAGEGGSLGLSRRTRMNSGPRSGEPKRSLLGSGRRRCRTTGKLCPGCGKIIHRERRSCGRRWCPVVHPTWLPDREAVIRRALQEHGGPFLVIALTQTQDDGWWTATG